MKVYRDSLLKMVHNPGGDWHPGRGDNPIYIKKVYMAIWNISTLKSQANISKHIKSTSPHRFDSHPPSLWLPLKQLTNLEAMKLEKHQ